MRKILALTLIILLIPICVFARNTSFITDNASLLTEEEFNQLSQKLEEVNNENECDIIILTVTSLDGKTAQEYSDDYFDYNSFGFGDDNSGILLTIDITSRKWAMTTTGAAINMFSDSKLKRISENFVKYLSNGEYYDAFLSFIEDSEEVISAESWSYSSEDSGFPWILVVIASLIAFVIALIVVLVFKAQLKSVRYNRDAQSYVLPQTLNITSSNDIFLYSTVTKTAKPEPQNSTVHTGSSGTSHGGASGSF